MAHTLKTLRSAYRAIKVDSAHRQMGTRALQEAKWLEGRNAERVEYLLGQAAFHLPYAQEIAKRAAQ